MATVHSVRVRSNEHTQAFLSQRQGAKVVDLVFSNECGWQMSVRHSTEQATTSKAKNTVSGKVLVKDLSDGVWLIQFMVSRVLRCMYFHNSHFMFCAGDHGCECRRRIHRRNTQQYSQQPRYGETMRCWTGYQVCSSARTAARAIPVAQSESGGQSVHGIHGQCISLFIVPAVV